MKKGSIVTYYCTGFKEIGIIKTKLNNFEYLDSIDKKGNAVMARKENQYLINWLTKPNRHQTWYGEFYIQPIWKTLLNVIYSNIKGLFYRIKKKLKKPIERDFISYEIPYIYNSNNPSGWDLMDLKKANGYIDFHIYIKGKFISTIQSSIKMLDRCLKIRGIYGKVSVYPKNFWTIKK